MPRIDVRFGTRRPGDSSAAGDGGAANGEGSLESLAAGVPLGQIVSRTLVSSPSIVMLDPSPSIAAEKFRRLKTKLVNEYKDSAQVIVVTSAAPREGKSFVSLNLALAFAADPGDTVLVDADLRRPTVHKLLSPEPALGLSEVLNGAVSAEHALARLKNSPLRVLPGGRPALNPVELFATEACKKLIASLRSEYQRVIIDTPPVVPFTDADALGALADGIILVVRAGSTPRAALTQAISMVTSTRLLGTVLNDVTFNWTDEGHYHQYYHSYYHENKTK